jgi:hypothetical protein
MTCSKNSENLGSLKDTSTESFYNLDLSNVADGNNFTKRDLDPASKPKEFPIFDEDDLFSRLNKISQIEDFNAEEQTVNESFNYSNLNNMIPGGHVEIEEFEGNYNIPKNVGGTKRPVQGANSKIPKPTTGLSGKGPSGKVSKNDSVKNLGSKPAKAGPGRVNCSQNSEKSRPESKTRQSYSNYNTSAGDKKSVQVNGTSLINGSIKSSTNLGADKKPKQIPQVSRVQDYKHNRSASLVNSETLAS